MAVNTSRSMRGDLTEGTTDGKYRKRRPDTTVISEDGDALLRANRASLHPNWNYGFPTVDWPDKVNPGDM